MKRSGKTIASTVLLALARKWERKANKARGQAEQEKTLRENGRLKAAHRALMWCVDDLRRTIHKANAQVEFQGGSEAE